MEKVLNLAKVSERCEAKGYSQSAIAEQIGISRQAVSKWFKGKSMPRPAELLKLGRLLELSHPELVVKAQRADEPVVAFRRRGTCKTTDAHYDRARNMGLFLKALVPYLDVDPFRRPPTLKNPSTDYAYLQKLAFTLRQEMKVGETDVIRFEDLIDQYAEAQAVIIPVMWGHRTKHENALHIHLPESRTTWVYLNLDVRPHDFKFWMAHELGHALSIEMLTSGDVDAAEDFADAFAGALLFPESLAETAYEEYAKAGNEKERNACLFKYAREHAISPNSVLHETRKFAEAYGKDFIPPEKLYYAIAKLNKVVPDVSGQFFSSRPLADHFMRVTQEVFQTPFFKALGEYIREHNPSRNVMAAMLGVNPFDADAFLDALKG